MAEATEEKSMTDQKPNPFLAALREATVECQSRLEHDYGTCAAGCKDGYVPLIPGLTRPCPRCMGRGRIRPTKVCPECRGGQMLVSEAEAVMALLDYCKKNGLSVHHYSEAMLKSNPKLKAVDIYNGTWAGGEWFDGDTLAEAVARALGLVKECT